MEAVKDIKCLKMIVIEIGLMLTCCSLVVVLVILLFSREKRGYLYFLALLALCLSIYKIGNWLNPQKKKGGDHVDDACLDEAMLTEIRCIAPIG